MSGLTILTKKLASPWSVCQCGMETKSFVDVDAEGQPERLVFTCPKCGPLQILYAAPQDPGRKKVYAKNLIDNYESSGKVIL